jgi:N-methylhydantoinase A
LTAGLDLPSQPNVTDANSFAPTPSTVNRGYFESTGTVDLPVFLGEDLSPGAAIEGPALILEPTTTVVVYPGMSARVSGVDNYVLSTSSAAVMKQPRSAQSEEV